MRKNTLSIGIKCIIEKKVKLLYNILMSSVQTQRCAVIGFLSLCVLLSACSSTTKEQEDAINRADVHGAEEATWVITNVAATPQLFYRPAALVGLYVTEVFSDGGFIPVASARKGIEVQMILHGRPTDDEAETIYELLDDYTTILKVNVPDLLNQSVNRAETLNQYVSALTNITARAQVRREEVEQNMGTLRDRQTVLRRRGVDLDREAKQAMKNQQYQEAGEFQEQAAEVDAELSQAQIEMKQQNDIEIQLADLIEVGVARLKAISENRELLIAGLKAVDLPGVDDLGVIQRSQRRRSTGTTPFGLP